MVAAADSWNNSSCEERSCGMFNFLECIFDIARYDVHVSEIYHAENLKRLDVQNRIVGTQQPGRLPHGSWTKPDQVEKLSHRRRVFQGRLLSLHPATVLLEGVRR